MLSKASIVGALTGLFAGVPLYYFFGTRGIVPAMILFAAVNLIFYHWNVGKATGNIRPSENSLDFKSVSRKTYRAWNLACRRRSDRYCRDLYDKCVFKILWRCGHRRSVSGGKQHDQPICGSCLLRLCRLTIFQDWRRLRLTMTV